jgi:hypothetical protein
LLDRLKRPLFVLLIWMLCFLLTKPADAGIAGASNGKTAGVLIALVGVGVLIGVGVYVAVHHGHSLKGCASSGAAGLQVLNEGNQKTYLLSGNVDGIKPGNRIGVSGTKSHGGQGFVVAKLSKDYGLCRP